MEQKITGSHELKGCQPSPLIRNPPPGKQRYTNPSRQKPLPESKESDDQCQIAQWCKHLSLVYASGNYS